MTVEIRRGTSRFVDREPGRLTHHAFSFGPHYDPAHVGFGSMVCHDDHVLGSGRGFDQHRHAGLDIVSFVVEGTLVHTDPAGSRHRVRAGSLAHLAAGAGVEHAEHASTDGPCRFVQVWLTSAEPDAEPSYVVTDAGDVNVGDARLVVVRLAAGDDYALPVAPLVHVYVARGALTRFSLAEPLSTGDAFLMTDEPSHVVTAGVPTTLLVWTLPHQTSPSAPGSTSMTA